MLTRATVTAVQSLVYLGLLAQRRPLPLHQIAQAIKASPTYLAKLFADLAKRGIVVTHKGVGGGVEIRRDPKRITLLEIVEACQGIVSVPSCNDPDLIPQSQLWATCAFHQALMQLQQAVKQVLEQWTLADLIGNPAPSGRVLRRMGCECWLYVAYQAALRAEAGKSARVQAGRQPGLSPTGAKGSGVASVRRARAKRGKEGN